MQGDCPDGGDNTHHKNILLTPLEKDALDSILLDIDGGVKQVIKVIAHDNPQNQWNVNITANHNVGDVCRIIAQKQGTTSRFQLSEVCSGREKDLDPKELILDITSKWRKNKKYQFVIRPASNNSSPVPAHKSSNPLLESKEISIVRVYYYLNPATYWTIPVSITLTCDEVRAQIATKLQLPEKEACYLYVVDDSKIHAGAVVAPQIISPDQNIKALLLQHRNSAARLVVSFKQLSDFAEIPPLPKDVPYIPSPNSIPSPPSMRTVAELPQPSIPNPSRQFNTKAFSPSNFQVYSLPPTSTTPTMPLYKATTACPPSFTFSSPPPSTRSESPIEKPSPKASPSSSPTRERAKKEQQVSFFDKLRNDLKEENKALDRRQKLYDDSWLDIPGYDFKPAERTPPNSSPTPSPGGSPSPNRRGKSTSPNRLSVDESSDYHPHPMELSAANLKESLGEVDVTNEQARDQYREEVEGYQQKLKDAFASIK